MGIEIPRISLLFLLEVIFLNPTSSDVFGGSQFIIDHGDSFLTISLVIGGLEYSVVPDTGSFELYMMDGDTNECTSTSPYNCNSYNPSKSKSHISLDGNHSWPKTIVFGSGSANAQLGFDIVSLVDTSSKEIDETLYFPIWEFRNMSTELKNIWDPRFQGIVGMGFSPEVDTSSSDKSKELEAAEIVDLITHSVDSKTVTPSESSWRLFGRQFAICLSDTINRDESLHDDIKPSVLHLRGNKRSRNMLGNVTSISDSMPMGNITTSNTISSGVHSKSLWKSIWFSPIHRLFTSLLEKEGNDSSPGVLWWGDQTPRPSPVAISVPVIGKKHWVIKVKGISVSSSRNSRRRSVDLTKHETKRENKNSSHVEVFRDGENIRNEKRNNYCRGKINKNGDKCTLFCIEDSGERCAALIDSGTSLLAFPADHVDALISEIQTQLDNSDISDGNNCRNSHRYPNIYVDVTNEKGLPEEIIIPPSAYIMRIKKSEIYLYQNVPDLTLLLHDKKSEYFNSTNIIDGQQKNEEPVSRLPKINSGILLKSASHATETPNVFNIQRPTSLLEIPPDLSTELDEFLCVPAFMASPVSHGEVDGLRMKVIIMGIPIFRKYTIIFDRANKEISFDLTENSTHDQCRSPVIQNKNIREEGSDGDTEVSVSDELFLKMPSVNMLKFPHIREEFVNT